jgi:signal transduction histidine kinase/integral membrane sensor domain MASE1/CheY-like chemotaxis protein
VSTLAQRLTRLHSNARGLTSGGWTSLASQNLVMAIAFYCGARVGLLLTLPHTDIGLLWPPAGIAIALMTRWGYRTWPGIIVGACAANLPLLLPYHSAATAIAIAGSQAIADVAATMLGAYWLRSALRGGTPFGQLPDVVRFAALVALASQAVGATLGVPVMHLLTGSGWSALGNEWLDWWVGDALSVLLLTPLILLWLTEPRSPTTHGRGLEAIAYLAAAAATLVVFVWSPFPDEWFEYFAILFVIGAAATLGQRATAAVSLIVASVAIASTATGYGPFVTAAPSDSLLVLGVFLSTLSVSGLVFGGVLAERARAEQMARHLASFPQFSPLPIIEFGLGASVIFTNPAMRSTIEEMAIDDPRLLIPPLWAKRLAGTVEPGGDEDIAEIELGGRVFEERIHYIPAAHSLRLYLSDVTERRSAERTIAESESRYRDLFESSPVAIWEEDLSGAWERLEQLRRSGIVDIEAYLRGDRSMVEQCAELVSVIDVNGAAVRLHGAASKQELISNLTRTLTPKSYDAFHKELVAMWAGEPHVQMDTGLQSLNGEPLSVTLSWTVAPGHEADYSRVIVVIVDETDRRRLEDQLRQGLKMEAIGRLAGGVAHDFNNLLTAIHGFAELHLGEHPPDDPGREDVLEIARAAERAAQLTRGLLAFGRRAEVHPEPLDLGDVARDAAGLMRRLVGENIVVSLNTEPELPCVLADRSHIDQILLNLAANARDAMPAGGVLGITVRPMTLNEAFVVVHRGAGTGRYVLLEVSDTGVGMDEATRAHLFEPFYTTKPRGEGTGLGLASVYGSVKQAGGYIDVESSQGGGSIFRIYLPTIEGVKAKAPKELATSPARGRGTETILLVEDEPAVCGFARRVLEGEGYRVVAFGDPAVALEALIDDPGSVDALITDIVMPTMSGPALAERITALRPGLPVLFMTGYAAGGLPAGAQAPLSKPFGAQELIDAAAALFGRIS